MLARFRDYLIGLVETQLAPTLQPGDVIRRENDPPDRFLTLLIPRQSGRPQEREGQGYPAG
ncbi:hypothetical protein AB9K34_03705, partial [Sedimentitalea sp. XS_ASV28]|uniref:hypothetical protein n=1 Tax=Sedimentitalea sp. XS_ASV28 TaxID=3241296 RepID=UPI003513C252